MSKKIKCTECAKEFSFTDKDQAFYSLHNFADPIRCKQCQKKLKIKRLKEKRELEEIKVI